MKLKLQLIIGIATLFVTAGLASCHRKIVLTSAVPATPAVAPTCALESSATVVQIGAVVHIHARSVFPNQDALNYFWTLQGGTLRGNGADMAWRPKDAPPGEYVIRARVEDGHGNEATCAIQVEVAASH
jgi:hypothetical protein